MQAIQANICNEEDVCLLKKKKQRKKEDVCSEQQIREQLEELMQKEGRHYVGLESQE